MRMAGFLFCLSAHTENSALHSPFSQILSQTCSGCCPYWVMFSQIQYELITTVLYFCGENWHVNAYYIIIYNVNFHEICELCLLECTAFGHEALANMISMPLQLTHHSFKLMVLNEN